jgi:hypothetical protein
MDETVRRNKEGRTILNHAFLESIPAFLIGRESCVASILPLHSCIFKILSVKSDGSGHHHQCLPSRSSKQRQQMVNWSYFCTGLALHRSSLSMKEVRAPRHVQRTNPSRNCNAVGNKRSYWLPMPCQKIPFPRTFAVFLPSFSELTAERDITDSFPSPSSSFRAYLCRTKHKNRHSKQSLQPNPSSNHEAFLVVQQSRTTW